MAAITLISSLGIGFGFVSDIKAENKVQTEQIKALDKQFESTIERLEKKMDRIENHLMRINGIK